jgi:uncharacterized membrane protein YsdA (DUF1294 family)
MKYVKLIFRLLLGAFMVYAGFSHLTFNRQSDIPEATLLLLAVIGGSIGALLGMQVWHHKTMHKKFKYGLPMILLAQIALIYFINK